MKLPNQLMGWSQLLSLFPEDIAQHIDAIAKQLSPFIDSVHHKESMGDIEPDGVSGLTTKANYERLLLGEWGLKDQFPDEFIRRAVSGEHLFLNQQRVDHSEDKHCFALFDCGPKQLGRPRLVQLAILILLARKASKLGVTLFWGVMQDDDYTLYSDINKESIKAWLNYRSVKLTNENQLGHWLSVFTNRLVDETNRSNSTSGSEQSKQIKLNSLITHGHTIEDLWLISPKTLEHTIDYQQVTISEPLFDLDEIDVTLTSKNNRQALSLTLGDDALNIRTIRDPFTEEKKTQFLIEENHVGKWASGVSGMRIACLNSIGKVAFYSFNKHKLSKVKPERMFSLNDRKLVGLFVSKKASIVVSYDDEYVYIDNTLNKKLSFKVNKPDYMTFSDEKLAKVVVVSESNFSRLFILDDAGNVSRIDILNTQSSFERYCTDVIALGQSKGCGWLLTNNETNVRLERYLGRFPVGVALELDPLDRSQKVFSHGSGKWSKGNIGCFAIEVLPNTWELLTGTYPYNTRISVDESIQVIGVMTIESGMIKEMNLKNNESKLVLVTIDNNSTTVSVVWKDGKHRLVELQKEFVMGELHPQHPFLHYINKSKELIIINLLTNNTLFQLSQGSSAWRF